MKYHEDLGISKANWQFILNNSAIATDKVLEVLYILLQSPGYKLSASNVAKALNIENYQSVVNTMVNFSKKTAIQLKLKNYPFEKMVLLAGGIFLLLESIMKMENFHGYLDLSWRTH